MKRFSATKGFTLVEILVSMGVLILLVVMVTQLTNSATNTITNSRKHMDADSQARLIFNRMATDFEKMVKRPDVDYVFCKSNGQGSGGSNDAMFFFSEAPAYFDNAGTSSSSKNSVALVGYRINSKLQLERLGKGLTWDGSTVNSSNPAVPGGVVFLASGSTSATPLYATTIAGDGTPANQGNWTSLGTAAGAAGSGSAFSDGSDSDYHVLAEQAYRLEIAFKLSDGTISTQPILSNPPAGWPVTLKFYNPSSADPVLTSDSTQNYAVGSRWYNTSSGQGYICTNATPNAAVWNRIGIQDISAIIVSVAILDTNSRLVVTNTSKLIGALRDPTSTDFTTTPPVLMAQTWLGAVNSTNFAATSGIPQSAASQVRIYQCYFYLPTSYLSTIE